MIWLVIIVAIEIVVRMQDRDVSRGSVITILTRVKVLGYVLLLGL